MKFAIMATGGVGGYFGARLSDAGHDVTFIARGAHEQAIEANGLRIASALGDIHLKTPIVTDDPADVGPVDVVIFAVKLWDTLTSAETCKPLVGPDTMVVPFQNGVESMPTLMEILGTDRVIGGIAQIASVISEPGAILHTSPFARLRFGEPDGSRSQRCVNFLNALQDAGVEAELTQHIDRVIWEKFAFLVALSGVTSVTRSTLGPILDDPDVRALFKGVMTETHDVGVASGIVFTEGFLDGALDFARSFPPSTKASMFHDLERGGRLELPWLSGGVVRMGEKLGVETPINKTIYAALKLYSDGTPTG